MIEQFTDDEIETIRKELAELDEQSKDKQKPFHVYAERIANIFADRPAPVDRSYSERNSIRFYERTVESEILTSIDKIVSLTLDCTEIELSEKARPDGGFNYRCSMKRSPNIPQDLYGEYCSFYDTIIKTIEENIKPYKRYAYSDTQKAYRSRVVIGDNITRLREQKHLTEKELARRAGMGLCTLCAYERGDQTIDDAELKTIAEILGTDVECLKQEISD